MSSDAFGFESGRRPTRELSLLSLPRADTIRAGLRREIEVLGGTSLLASVCLLVQAIVGGGLLVYPHAFMTGGIINIIVLQVLMLAFIAPGLWTLAVCTERTGATSYQALMKQLLGRKAEVVCEIVIVSLIFGASVTYLDIFVDQVQPWLEEVHERCEGASAQCTLLAFVASREKLTVLAAGAISLLCLGRNMASLSIPSLIGFGALIYVSCVILANFLVEPQSHSGSARSAPVWLRTEASSWSSMLPVICFSYQGHISAVPMYAELQRRSMRRWLVVISVALAACIVLYNATGLIGYLQFLESTQSDVLKNFVMPGYTANIPVACVSVARIAVAMAVAVTLAVYTYCARSAIVDEVNRFRGPASEQLPYSAFLVITYVWVALLAIVAVCCPDIGIVVSFVGNLCAIAMFHFPGFCLIAIAEPSSCEENSSLLRSPGGQQTLTGWLFVTVGTLVFIFGMLDAWRKLP